MPLPDRSPETRMGHANEPAPTRFWKPGDMPTCRDRSTGNKRMAICPQQRAMAGMPRTRTKMACLANASVSIVVVSYFREQ
jgi:hypothetical protein